MANETQEVVQEQPKVEGQEAQAPTTGQTAETTQTVDYKAEYEKIEPRYKELDGYWTRLENVMLKSPWVEQAIRDAMAGKKWTPEQAAAVEAATKQGAKTETKPPSIDLKSLPEYQEIKTMAEELKREKELGQINQQLASEMQLITEKFSWMKEPKAQADFIKELEQKIKEETLQAVNSGVPMNEAHARAVNKWNHNLVTSFYLLKEKEIAEDFSNRGGRRSVLPPGVQTAADRVGKPGTMPDMHERYRQAISNESDDAKRTQLRIEWAANGGPTIDEQLASRPF